jgi:glutamyl-tRNA synthetase
VAGFALSYALTAAGRLPSGAQELVSDAAPQVSQLLSYPLSETLASAEAKSVVEDNFKEVRQAGRG